VANRLRGAVDSSYEIRVVDTLEQLAGLATGWNRLLTESRADSIFLTWEWLYTWSECFLGSERRPFVLMVHHRGELVGIAPWCVRTHRRWGISVRRIEFLGGPEGGSDYLDVFAHRGHEREVARSIYDHLGRTFRGWDSLHLRDIAADSLFLLHFLECIDEDGKFLDVRAGSFCPLVELPGSRSEFLAQLSPNRRQQYQRHFRTLQRHNDVAYESIRLENALPVLRRLYELHEARWPNMEPQFRFLESLVARCAGKDWIQADVLTAEGTVIAGLVHLRYAKTLSMYLMAVDYSYDKRISLGNIIVGLSIERALTEGLSTYDFLKGTEAYKFHWSTGGRRALDFEIHNARAVPLLLTTVTFVKSAAKLILR
jgi:CelD/BcsL family acetyltransferase involved in cellulose biosynthesis